MDVSCPYCGYSQHLAEEGESREIACPGCATTFTVTGSDRIAPLPGPDTAAARGADEHFAARLPSPLGESSEDYFAVAPAPKPPAVQGLATEQTYGEIVPSPPVAPPPVHHTVLAEEKVRGPAVAMIVLASLGIVEGLLLPLLSSLFVGNPANPDLQSELTQDLRLNSLLGLAFVAYNMQILLGALSMKALRSRGFAMSAAVLSLVPYFSPCALFRIVAGIWALRVLALPEVKGAFAESRR